jgi:VWFA-related protein
MRTAHRILIAALVAATFSPTVQGQDGFKFKSGVDLVNLTATVTDDNGRFVPGLTKEDFAILDNGQAQAITHFSSERVPVSLGILLDTSGSMTDEKMNAARSAINRFVGELLGPEDELFFMEFADRAYLRQDWTTDRQAITRAVRRVQAGGGTSMYDAIADALPIAGNGKHRKKAILVISDGNDTHSRTSVYELRQAIRESEVLVYALGVDGHDPRSLFPQQPPPSRPPTTTPFPPIPGIPGIGGGRGRSFPQIVIGGGGGGGNRRPAPMGPDARVNADALRQLTDDTGGRTEIVREFRDLDAATARIADELSRQYSLAFVAPGERDGRWHTIQVQVRNRTVTVRARRGYLAT